MVKTTLGMSGICSGLDFVFGLGFGVDFGTLGVDFTFWNDEVFFTATGAGCGILVVTVDVDFGLDFGAELELDFDFNFEFDIDFDFGTVFELEFDVF